MTTRPIKPSLLAWLLPLGALLTLAGFWGPWVDHPVAGLAILGLDLGEYVKFLPQVRAGEIVVWREGFYLPLVAASLALSLGAFRPELRYPWWLRALMLASAVVAACNLLPPAWTPPRMLTPEFQQQAVALALCLVATAFSPFLALLPRRVAGALLLLLSLPALVTPIYQFVRILPGIGVLYNHALAPAWGAMVMASGLLVLTFTGLAMVAGQNSTALEVTP